MKAIRCLAILLVLALLVTGCTGRPADAPVDQTPEPTAERTVMVLAPEQRYRSIEYKIGLIMTAPNDLLHRVAQHGFLRTAENLEYRAKLYLGSDSSEADALVDQAIADGCVGLLVWANDAKLIAAAEKAKQAKIKTVIPFFNMGDADVDANLAADPADYAEEAVYIMVTTAQSRGRINGAVIIIGAQDAPDVAAALQNAVREQYPQYAVEVYQGYPPTDGMSTQEELADAFITQREDIAGIFCLAPGSGNIFADTCAAVEKRLKPAATPTPKSTPTPKKTTAPSLSPSPSEMPAETPAVPEIPSYKRNDCVIITLDCMQDNLNLVADGKITACIVRPFYDSTAQSTVVLDRLLRGIPTQTTVRLNAPVIRKSSVEKYQHIVREAADWFGVR